MSIMKWILIIVATIFTMCMAWIVGDAFAAYFDNFLLGLLSTIFVCWFMGRGVGKELAKYL